MTDTRSVRALISDLESHLGDPADPGQALSWDAALRHDDSASFNHVAMNRLLAWDFHAHQVPATHGGKAVDIQDSLELFRVLARRDASVATTLATTSLSFMPVWVAGTDAQKRVWVERVKSGAFFGWCLSERDHGSDIVANDTVARPVEGGYLLDGEKWPIGNSAAGEVLTVVARTGARPGPAAFSILMVDRRRVPASSVRPGERLRLHGLKAIDNGGVQFGDCFVEHSARIGAEGQGLEIALKSALAVRALAPAMALGCVDTGLRLAMRFASRRQIFGGAVITVPYTRRTLVDAFSDLLLCDAVATGAARMLQVRPSQCSISSSVSKYFVPTVLERTMSDLSSVLGARHYIRSDPEYGVFHKMVRDLWISHFAEGNTVVNLKNISSQLPVLLAKAGAEDPAVAAAALATVDVVFDLDAPLPAFDPARLDMRSRSGDDVVTAIPALLERLSAQAAHATDPDAATLGEALVVARKLFDHVTDIGTSFDALLARDPNGWPRTDEAFRLAERYTLVHAAGAVLAMAVLGRERDTGVTVEPYVLLCCLARLWSRLAPRDAIVEPEVVDATADLLVGLYEQGRLFSHRRLEIRADHVTGGRS